MGARRWEIRVLGPFQLAVQGGPVLELPSVKQRAVLAMLVLHANRVVSLDDLLPRFALSAPGFFLRSFRLVC